MAYPVVLSRVTTNVGSAAAAASSWAFNVGSPSVGDLLVLVVSQVPSTSTPNTPSGWTQLQYQPDRLPFSAQYAAYRVADGTEGATQTFTFSANVEPLAVCFIVQAGTYSGAPVISSATRGNNIAPDPASFTSGFGVVDTLWVAVLSAYHNLNSVSSYPSGYGNQGSGYYGGPSNKPVLGWADIQTSSASEDTPAWGLTTAREFIANTIAIRGASTTATRRPTFLRAVRRVVQRYTPTRITSGAPKIEAPTPPSTQVSTRKAWWNFFRRRR